MCVIAGIVAVDGKALPPREPLERMLAAMAPLAGDGSVAAEPGIAVGVRRRVSREPGAGAAEPLRNAQGHLLVCDGAVYNHAELRAALPDAGQAAGGGAATLLAALAQRGEEALGSLNGAFAFAWWQRKERSLLLVRDRLGVKPLYYARTKQWLVFASELRALLASGLVPYEIDPQAVGDYLRLRYVPAPLTAAKGVFKLPAGHLLRIKRGRQDVAPWWRLTVAGADDPAPPDAQAAFEALLSDAVYQRLPGDAPVGVVLDGGIDSAAVAALVSQDRQIDTFSVAFEAGGGFYDDRFYARQIARRVGSRHHEAVVTSAQAAEALPVILERLDEPIMDLEAVPAHFLAELAQGEVHIALGGAGADEVLGGHRLNQVAFGLRALETYQQIPRGLRDAARSFLGARAREWLTPYSWPVSRFPALRGISPPRGFEAAEAKELLGEWGRGIASPGRHLEQAYRSVAHADPLNQILSVYAGAWMADGLLMKAGKLAAAAGLDLRLPFTDHRLVELLYALPGSLKVGGPASAGAKRMLRKAMRGRLPRGTLARDRRTFPKPLAAWVQSRPRWFEELLGANEGLIALFDRRAMTGLLQSARRGAPVWQRVWSLAVITLWDARMRGLAATAQLAREAA